MIAASDLETTAKWCSNIFGTNHTQQRRKIKSFTHRKIARPTSNTEKESVERTRVYLQGVVLGRVPGNAHFKHYYAIYVLFINRFFFYMTAEYYTKT